MARRCSLCGMRQLCAGGHFDEKFGNSTGRGLDDGFLDKMKRRGVKFELYCMALSLSFVGGNKMNSVRSGLALINFLFFVRFFL